MEWRKPQWLCSHGNRAHVGPMKFDSCSSLENSDARHWILWIYCLSYIFTALQFPFPLTSVIIKSSSDTNCALFSLPKELPYKYIQSYGFINNDDSETWLGWLVSLSLAVSLPVLAAVTIPTFLGILHTQHYYCGAGDQEIARNCVGKNCICLRAAENHNDLMEMSRSWINKMLRRIRGWPTWNAEWQSSILVWMTLLSAGWRPGLGHMPRRWQQKVESQPSLTRTP